MSINHRNLHRFISREIIESGTAMNHYPKAYSLGVLLERAAVDLGWKVINHGKGVRSYFSAEGLVGSTVHHIPSTMGFVADEICRDKALTKEFLKEDGIPHPRGRSFNAEEYKEGLEFFRKVEFPVVVKPSKGSRSIGVSMGITNDEEFNRAWAKAAGPEGKKTVLVEEYISGFDVRVLVIGGKGRAACSRVQPFILGDGQSKFSELVKGYEVMRHNDAYLRNRKLAVDERWILSNGWTDDTILDTGEVATLNVTSGVGLGGVTVDVFDRLHPKLIDMAERAAAVLPHVRIAGVDLFVNDILDPSGAVVLELNAKPFFDIHKYVTFGVPTDTPKFVLEDMASVQTVR